MKPPRNGWEWIRHESDGGWCRMARPVGWPYVTLSISRDWVTRKFGPATVNWSAIGETSLDTANLMAAYLREAVALGRKWEAELMGGGE